MTRCAQCGHFKNDDCNAGVIDIDGPDLAYTCLNLSKLIVEAMPDLNTTTDQVAQLRIQRAKLREIIEHFDGSPIDLEGLNKQIADITTTIIKLNWTDPDAEPIAED